MSHGSFLSSLIDLQSSNIDPQWKKLLDTVGVTDEQLEDKNTANFIYDFVEKHGGIQEANRQLEAANKMGPPPPPSRHGHGPPPPTRGGPSVGRRGLPPPPPRDSGHSGSKGNVPAPPPPPPVGKCGVVLSPAALDYPVMFLQVYPSPLHLHHCLLVGLPLLHHQVEDRPLPLPNHPLPRPPCLL